MCIVLDSDLGTGHVRCYPLAPRLFDTDDEVYSVEMTERVPVGRESQARLAVQNFPERNISIEQ